MRDQRHHLLSETAAAQHGVFTRRDLRNVGLPDNTATNGLQRGRYRRVLPGVFAGAGSPTTRMQLMAAAVLSMPALAAVSHRTAAELWGLTERGIRQIDVVTTRWDRVTRTDIQVHESLDFVEEDVTILEGVPTTTAARTVVDLGAVSPWDVERALENGIRRRRYSLSEVESVVARVGRKGRRGVGVIRPLLEARRKWDSVTDSLLEDKFRKLVAEAELPNPVGQYAVRDDLDAFVCRADFAYPDRKLIIELDSEAHHMDRITFRLDRAKQNRAIVLGWTVMRYTWWDIQDDPYRVGAEIRAALDIRPA